LNSLNPMEMEDQYKNFKAGYVAILGRPNVGKSTLLNQFLRFKLSIISQKPQTTRKKILGIVTSENAQIVFVDTPGLLDPKYNLQKLMTKYIHDAIADADVLLYLIEAVGDKIPFAIIKLISKIQKPIILAINKIDLIEKKSLLPLISKYDKRVNFSAIVPVSALKNDGIDHLREEILRVLPNNPPFFPPDYITDQPERFFVSEIIREKVFEHYVEEIPYSTHVQIEEFKERPKRKDYIVAAIYVERASQKGIIIGKDGKALKRAGRLARIEIEKFLDRPVYLELFVKVLGDWRRNNTKLKELGY
jgi:GTP-binding protein Era